MKLGHWQRKYKTWFAITRTFHKQVHECDQFIVTFAQENLESLSSYMKETWWRFSPNMTILKIYLMLLTSSSDAESIVSKLPMMRNKILITLKKGTSSSLQRKYYTIIILKRGDQRRFRKKIRVVCWVVVLLILWGQISQSP